MSSTLIRWGILGTSFISEVIAHAIRESETGELFAIGSRSIASAKQFAEKYAIPKYYADYQELLHDDDIDAIYIGLPNHLHKEWIVHAALAGKHILCEKPLVLNVLEAQEVIAQVEKSRVFCMEALMYSCHPFTRKLQELVDSKMIGDIKLYTATYTANIAEIANSTAGGSIRNLGCYPLSLVRLLAKTEPVDLCAMGRISQQNKTDNQASVILKFLDNSMAVISTADDIDMFWQFDIYGTEGHLKVLTNPWLPALNNTMVIHRNDEKTPIEIHVKAEKPLYTYQIDTVGNHILNKKDTQTYPVISLSDSLGNVRVLETWLQQVNAKKIPSELILA